MGQGGEADRAGRTQRAGRVDRAARARVRACQGLVVIARVVDFGHELVGANLLDKMPVRQRFLVFGDLPGLGRNAEALGEGARQEGGLGTLMNAVASIRVEITRYGSRNWAERLLWP